MIWKTLAVRAAQYGNAADWSGGTVPDATSDVLIANGRSVAVTGTGLAATMVVSHGGIVTVAGNGNLAATSLYNDGAITLADKAKLGFTSLQNSGRITIGEASVLGSTSGSSTFQNDGVLAATGAYAVMSGSFDNTGTVIVGAVGGTAASALYLVRAENVSNAGVLAGGNWIVNGGVLSFSGPAAVSALAGGGTIELRGANAVVGASNAGATLGQTLERLEAGSTLLLAGGQAFEAAQDLSVSGRLQLDDASLTGVANAAAETGHDSADLSVAAGATLSGVGRVVADATVQGTIEVGVGSGMSAGLQWFGDLDLSGAVTGRGTLTLHGGDLTIEQGAQLRTHALVVEQDARVVVTARSAAVVSEVTVDGGELQLGGHRLTLKGDLHLDDGSVRAGIDPDRGTIGTLATSGAITASGTSLITAGLTTTGSVEVLDGTLRLESYAKGTGSFVIDPGATLFMPLAASTLTVDFARSGGTLQLNNAIGFKATIVDFDAGDRIELFTVASGTRMAWIADQDGVGGTLRLRTDDEIVSLHFEENHARRDFHLVGDGAIGAVLTYDDTIGAASTGGVHHAIPVDLLV